MLRGNHLLIMFISNIHNAHMPDDNCRHTILTTNQAFEISAQIKDKTNTMVHAGFVEASTHVNLLVQQEINVAIIVEN